MPESTEVSDPAADRASGTGGVEGAVPRAGETPAACQLADVPAAFDRAAATYDRMVNLNPGYHRHLQAAADALVEKLPVGSGLTVVDLGCGSGASTDALVNSMGHRGQAYTAIGVDGSAGMLEQARSKPWPTWVSFAQARAEELSRVVGEGGHGADGAVGAAGNGSHGSAGAGGSDAVVAGVLAAYLFRNVADRDAVLRSVWELLAPGGVLVVQDYSVAGSPKARARWNAVSWSVVIPLSKVINRDTGIYRYLWRSVLDNDSVDDFAARMIGAGYTEVEHRTAGGWQRDILHTFRGRKPA
ncbi:MAG TPA: class I SAM-dependent methyltransferase [Microlunatus sp.]|nr:class I SAM-dependent methyltransferase [Microlunatus sp.]